MARAEMSYVGKGRFKVPIGVWIYLNYNEASAVTSSVTQEAVSQTVGRLGPWGAIAAAAVNLQQKYIRKLNEASGGKGVRCFFAIFTGLITSIERLGFSNTSSTSSSTIPPREDPHEKEPGTMCWCGKIHRPSPTRRVRGQGLVY